MMLIRPILLFLVGLALLLTVRPDDAIETSLIARADSYRTTFAYSMAQPYVRAALARQPWNAALYVRAGLIALGQRQYDEAQAQFDLAEQAGADHAEVEADRAELAEEQNQLPTAAAHWQNVTQARPFDQNAYRRRVDAYVNAEDWGQARLAAEDWLARLPDSAEAQLALAKVIVVEDPIGAEEHFALAPVDRAQPFLDALHDPLAKDDRAFRSMRLGRAFLSQNELHLAARAFLDATSVNANYAEAFAYYGFTLDQLGGDGTAQLDRAVELDPQLAVARYFRGWHAEQHGNLDQAMTDLQFALDRDPKNALIAAEIGRVYLQRNDYPSAEKWLTQARDLEPTNPVGWQALAELYIGRAYGLPTQALSTALRLVSLLPNDAGAHVWLGRAYLLAGNPAEADRELRRAIALDPGSAAAHLFLARSIGKAAPEGALEYERSLALDPNGPIGVLARRALELP